ncbi:MAG: carboxypeptidase-like regulatory domain-containing protein, partial [Thermoanaerobaculia bacterium]
APAPAGPSINVTGIVKDASNGLAIPGARATYGDQRVDTSNNGKFILNLPAGTPVIVTITHPAFLPFQKTVTAQNGVETEYDLTEQPSVTIQTTGGQTYVVDIGTAQFEYAITFSGYVASDNANFCKPDGTVITPSKLELSKIVGPATSSTNAACCSGPVMTANAFFKNGTSTQVFFKDSCNSTEVDFVGRLKSTGLYQHVRFTDIAEIDFP